MIVCLKATIHIKVEPCKLKRVEPFGGTKGWNCTEKLMVARLTDLPLTPGIFGFGTFSCLTWYYIYKPRARFLRQAKGPLNKFSEEKTLARNPINSQSLELLPQQISGSSFHFWDIVTGSKKLFPRRLRLGGNTDSHCGNEDFYPAVPNFVCDGRMETSGKPNGPQAMHTPGQWSLSYENGSDYQKLA